MHAWATEHRLHARLRREVHRPQRALFDVDDEENVATGVEREPAGSAKRVSLARIGGHLTKRDRGAHDEER
jgi:hypothetical protein